MGYTLVSQTATVGSPLHVPSRIGSQTWPRERYSGSGIAGCGSHSMILAAGVLRLSEGLPVIVIVEVVDEEDTKERG
ncbi:MAG TPA: hypothetical protein EYH50_01100 [Pyrodictium delaneyi]|uniref:Uncharacterized protein n=1 Tax=Pyrodictium delaneyi TaxID=1273541 RepID=A0A832ZTT6_9CREN|nr:hypothetical protein [Pyrodictium delaneyi]